MARAARKSQQDAKTPVAPVSHEARVARLLALLLIRDVAEKAEQVALLRAAGFEISEIADLLRMSPNHVSVIIYSARKKKKPKAK